MSPLAVALVLAFVPAEINSLNCYLIGAGRSELHECTPDELNTSPFCYSLTVKKDNETRPFRIQHGCGLTYCQNTLSFVGVSGGQSMKYSCCDSDYCNVPTQSAPTTVGYPMIILGLLYLEIL